MLAALFLEPILAGLFKIPWVQHSRGLRYAYAEWQVGSTLQIHRLAHESLGAGSWSNTTGPVPITKAGEQLAALDISNSAHPHLARSSVELAKVDYNESPVRGEASPRYSKLPTVEQI